MAHFAEGNTLGKLGVFFLGQACFDYPVAVGCVVSFHGCEPPFVGGFFQAAQAAKGGLGVATPTRFPQDKIERLAKFGTVVESCSKKVAASSVWAFADTPGLFGVDSANYAAVFLPLLLTTHGKANLAKFPGISFRVFITAFDKNGRISSVLQ